MFTQLRGPAFTRKKKKKRIVLLALAHLHMMFLLLVSHFRDPNDVEASISIGVEYDNALLMAKLHSVVRKRKYAISAFSGKGKL